MANERGYNPGLIMGILAIVIGGLFLLDNSGYIHVGNLWRFWPVILIILGINGMLQRDARCGRGIVGSGITLIWGILLLAASLGYIGWAHMWPWFLVGLGLLLIWETYRPKSNVAVLTSGALHPESVFSSIEKTITDQNFQRGSASAIFGSVELDFIQANMAGEAAVLEVNVIFGSIEVRVPLNWNVSIEAGAVFGACENKTRGPIPAAGATKTLIIRGGAVFGSVEVKN